MNASRSILLIENNLDALRYHDIAMSQVNDYIESRTRVGMSFADAMFDIQSWLGVMSKPYLVEFVAQFDMTMLDLRRSQLY